MPPLTTTPPRAQEGSAAAGAPPADAPTQAPQPGPASHDGNRPTMEPARKRGLAALLDGWEPLDEDVPDISDPPPAPARTV